MDKDLQQSRGLDETVRVQHIDEALQGNNHKQPHEGAPVRASGKIRVEQLRRDQEASKRLREEAYAKRRMAQNSQAAQQFEAAQRVANAGRAQQAKAQMRQAPQAPAQRPVQRQQTTGHQPVVSQKAQALQPKAQAAPQKAQTPQPKAQAAPQKVQSTPPPTPQAPSSAQDEKRAQRREKRQKYKQEAVAVAGELAHNDTLKRVGKRGLGCLFYIILFFLVIAIAFGTLWAVRSHQAPTPIQNIPAEQQAAVAKEREKSNVYILLAGTDQRADETSRSDTIIYAAVRPVDRKVEMVSIPRDTLVSIPEVGEAKMNSALAYGGMDLLAETVSGLVDNPVDHTVLVNFQSFAKIIDAMGGIKMDVPEKMYLPEENIDLEAGEQTLNGEDALAFVRWRGDGLGDIGRMERQSQFMQAVMDKMRHLPPWRWATTLWAVSHEIETDLSTMDLLSLAWHFIGMDKGALEYQSFELNPTYIDGVSYVLLDDYNINEVLQNMKYGMVIDDTAFIGQDDESYY